MNVRRIRGATRVTLLLAVAFLAGCEPPVKYSSRLAEAVANARSAPGAVLNLTQVCASQQLPDSRSLADVSPGNTPTATELLVSIRPPLEPGESIEFLIAGGQSITPVRRHPSGRFITFDLATDIVAPDVVQAIHDNPRVYSVEVNCRYAYPEIPAEARVGPNTADMVPVDELAQAPSCAPTTATCAGIYGASLPWTPGDTEFQNANLWGLESIRAFPVWQAGINSVGKQVLVAVIDTGVNYDHSELAPNMWTNPNDSEANHPDDGLDNDGNGCADDIHGCSFDGMNGCPVTETSPAGIDCSPRDYYGHGTIVASILGAQTDNGAGLASPAWDVTMIPIRVGNLQYLFTPEDLASAIAYAASVGADVANISLSIGTDNSPTVEAEIIAADDVLFVAGAGKNYVSYPAKFAQDNILSVSGIHLHSCLDDEAKPAVLPWDANSVDIGAPGVQVCAICGTGYCYDQGTSVAAPFVSSAAALVRSIGDFSPDEIREIIITNRRYSPHLVNSVSHGTLDITFLTTLEPPAPPWYLLGAIAALIAIGFGIKLIRKQ